jgi:hypothetical protein
VNCYRVTVRVSGNAARWGDAMGKDWLDHQTLRPVIRGEDVDDASARARTTFLDRFDVAEVLEVELLHEGDLHPRFSFDPTVTEARQRALRVKRAIFTDRIRAELRAARA